MTACGLSECNASACACTCAICSTHCSCSLRARKYLAKWIFFFHCMQTHSNLRRFATIRLTSASEKMPDATRSCSSGICCSSCSRTASAMAVPVPQTR
jgi:hypothetical protein